MPCTYRVLADSRLVNVTGVGTVNLADLVSVYESLRDDPAFRASFDSIWDFSEVDATDLGSAGVGSLVRLPRIFDQGSRRAVVVRSDLGFGLTRMFLLRGNREGDDVAIFRSVEEGYEWLGRGLGGEVRDDLT